MLVVRSALDKAVNQLVVFRETVTYGEFTSPTAKACQVSIMGQQAVVVSCQVRRIDELV